MKNLSIMAGVLALGLTACAGIGAVDILQGFGIDADITGANVSVTVTAATATTSAKIQTLITQPTVVFNARPQSVGFQLQKYTVEVLDNAGVRYAADEGIYQRSASAIVAPGFVCTATGTDAAVPPLDQCLPTAKSPANVPTSVGSLPMITGAVADQIANDCYSGTCPTLKLKVTFSGLDDAGRAKSIVVAGANVFIETHAQ